MRTLTFILILLFSISGCASKEPLSDAGLGVRHQETGENSHFRFGNLPFEKYVEITKRKILRNRVDITVENKEKILAANSPFEWKPDAKKCPKNYQNRYKNGVLMLHGLSDSPFHMQELARYFVGKCYLVRAMLLPGHGTVPGDLLRTRYEEWIKATEYGINSFKGLVDNLSLVGFSTGGALSVYGALKREDIKSVLLFAPALKIKNDKIFLSGTVETLSGVVDSLTWVDLAEDLDYAKYESFPINAAYQIYQLTLRTDQLLKKRTIKIPVFIAASEDDMTIETARTVEFFTGLDNKKNRMILYSNKTQNFKDDRITIRPGRYPKENVSELSHLSLLASPDNAHYGRKGDYRNCLHYLQIVEKMERCKSEIRIPSGEILTGKLSGPVFRRLTYNPDFYGLLKEIDNFLISTDQSFTVSD